MVDREVATKKVASLECVVRVVGDKMRKYLLYAREG
jgi:hypothetical protein